MTSVEIMTSGRPLARYELLLKERYNSEWDYIGGCCPNSYQAAYVRGYHHAAALALDRQT